MRVQFLGTGGYHPNERRHTACVYVPQSGVVFDAGTATFRLPGRLESREIDVFLSHAHLDHIIGLTYLLVPMAQGVLDRVRVFGQRKTLVAVREHLFAELTFPIMPEFEFCDLEEYPEVRLQDGGVLTHHPLVSHPGGSTAFRIDWPRQPQGSAPSLAYVTDTCVDGTYTEFIGGVDVLIHECFFSDDMADWAQKTGHSHTTPVVQLARDARVGQLILIHTDPQREDSDPLGLQAAIALYAETRIAEDGLVIDF